MGYCQFSMQIKELDTTLIFFQKLLQFSWHIPLDILGGLKLHYNSFDIPEKIYDWEDPQRIIKYILDHQEAKNLEEEKKIGEQAEAKAKSKQMPPPPSVPPL